MGRTSEQAIAGSRHLVRDSSQVENYMNPVSFEFMKKVASSFSVFLFAFVAYAVVETGAKAPDFELTDTTSVSHKLSDFAGKYVVLEWTNHECPFVKKFYKEGDMQALQEEMTGKDVVWLQIISSAEGSRAI